MAEVLSTKKYFDFSLRNYLTQEGVSIDLGQSLTTIHLIWQFKKRLSLSQYFPPLLSERVAS